jgi:ACS family glucarate transporter-like MFS transporter
VEQVKVETLETGAAFVGKAVKLTNIRWEVLWLMAFCGFISYCDRVNLSVTAPLVMEHFGIDKVQLGYVMAAFFIPYAIMQIPGGMMAQRQGTRGTVALCVVWWSLFTILTPMAWGLISLVLIRATFAVGEAPLSPCMSTIANRWSNTKDKAKATVFVIIGSFSGPIVGAPLTSWIMTQWNWQTVFYAYGAFGLMFAAFWYWHHRSFPHEHPRANRAEVEYIEEKSKEQAAADVVHAKETAPWLRFLQNYRFWSFGLCYFSLGYVMFLFLSWIPMYLLEARGMNMKAMGFATGYPWIAICITVVIFGWVSDWMIKKGLTKFQTRVIPGSLGLLFCGIALFKASGATSVSENLFWLIACFGFLGVTYVGTIAAALDVGKRFGGSVFSWLNAWTCVAGILAPIVTAMIVKAVGWQTALNFSALIPVAGAVLFLLVKPDKPLPGTEDKVNFQGCCDG